VFKLRKEHLEAFRDLYEADFVEQVCERLSDEYSAQTATLDEDEIRRRVRVCLPRASGYGLQGRLEIAAFIYSTFLLAEHFDTEPPHQEWAQMVLKSSIPAHEKAEIVFEVAQSIARGLPPPT
jgi:hypothetical protein